VIIMIQFTLIKHGHLTYEIHCNGNLMITEQFISDRKAIEWANGYISSWSSASLTINL